MRMPPLGGIMGEAMGMAAGGANDCGGGMNCGGGMCAGGGAGGRVYENGRGGGLSIGAGGCGGMGGGMGGGRLTTAARWGFCLCSGWYRGGG